jgi:hypothetical protein
LHRQITDFNNVGGRNGKHSVSDCGKTV